MHPKYYLIILLRRFFMSVVKDLGLLGAFILKVPPKICSKANIV